MPWPLPLLPEIVYGPFTSGRLGATLEINLLPANLRVCNLSCGYCHFRRTQWRQAGSRRRGPLAHAGSNRRGGV
jgi:wyosine [tRNA(Phe)-imidazoG37] synthetase (radical SAM superfamily)